LASPLQQDFVAGIFDQQHKGTMTQTVPPVALVAAGGTDLVVVVVDKD
jgi:hypothetical protein